MILSNATILRIDAAPVVGLDNTSAYCEGPATAIRCCWQDPKTGRKWILGAAVADASAVLYLDGNQQACFALEGRVLLQVDGEQASRLYVILQVAPQVGLGMDNTEVYLKG